MAVPGRTPYWIKTRSLMFAALWLVLAILGAAIVVPELLWDEYLLEFRFGWLFAAQAAPVLLLLVVAVFVSRQDEVDRRLGQSED